MSSKWPISSFFYKVVELWENGYYENSKEIVGKIWFQQEKKWHDFHRGEVVISYEFNIVNCNVVRKKRYGRWGWEYAM